MLNSQAKPISVPLESPKAIAPPAKKCSETFDGHALMAWALTGACLIFGIGAAVYAYKCDAPTPILVMIGLSTFSAPRISIFMCAGF
jgi:hypothetical protein